MKIQYIYTNISDTMDKSKLENIIMNNLSTLDIDFLSLIMQIKMGDLVDVDHVKELCIKYDINILTHYTNNTLDDLISIFGIEFVISQTSGDFMLLILNCNPTLFISLNNKHTSAIKCWNADYKKTLMQRIKLDQLSQLHNGIHKWLIDKDISGANVHISHVINYVNGVYKRGKNYNISTINTYKNIIYLKTKNMDKKDMNCAMCLSNKGVPIVYSCGHSNLCIECFVSTLETIDSKELKCYTCESSVESALVCY